MVNDILTSDVEAYLFYNQKQIKMMEIYGDQDLLLTMAKNNFGKWYLAADGQLAFEANLHWTFVYIGCVICP